MIDLDVLVPPDEKGRSKCPLANFLLPLLLLLLRFPRSKRSWSVEQESIYIPPLSISGSEDLEKGEF